LPGIVFLDSVADGQTVEDAAIVSQVAQRFDALRAEALPRGASRDMVRKVAEAMDVTGATWRTSSYTGSGGGNCVEVATTPKTAAFSSATPRSPGTSAGLQPPVLAALHHGDQGSAPVVLNPAGVTGISRLDDLPAVSARSAASDVPDRDRLFGDLVKHPVPAYP